MKFPQLVVIVALVWWKPVALAQTTKEESLPGKEAASQKEEAPGGEWVLGTAELYRLDRLPVFRPSVRVASVSSHDRTGGNDDGFSGRHSFVREEPDGLVIADLKGPGIVYRIWTPTPTDDLVEFFFDDEAKPRIQVKFRSIFLGTDPPFLGPLVGFGAGGFYSYVPLPYARSLKVRVRARRVQFYQINYAHYPESAPVKTFEVEPSKNEIKDREKARRLFALAGTDLSSHVVPEGCALDVFTSRASLGPSKSVTIFESPRPGRIAGIRLAPAEAFSGKGRDLLLRITFDGDRDPAVLCPAGDFFGFAWGEPAVTSLLVGTSRGVNYCYFPMPFDRSAKLEVISERDSGEPVNFEAQVAFAPLPRSTNEGKFYAIWRRENPTTEGAPFTFLQAEGRGHLVGCVLQAQGLESGKTLFFEGDDQTTIDGELTIHGTGSEDFFNGGWYDVPDRWEKRLSFPLSGCLGYQKQLGRTGGYRLLIGDAYAFQRSILQAIEHGGTGNSIPTDYCGVTYFYAAERPRVDLAPPPRDSRKVVDFKKIVFPAWWQIPIHAFPFQNATLTRGGEKLGEEDIRFLSLKAEGQDWFGPPFISLVCDLPAAGRYVISIEVVLGSAQGCVQLFHNEVPAGEPVDLYAGARRKSQALRLGTLAMSEGANVIMLKLVSKNERSSGLGMDLIQLICERME